MSTDPRVTKRRVIMKSISLTPGGEPVTYEAVDYVRPDHLDAYVADARTRWQPPVDRRRPVVRLPQRLNPTT